MRRRGTGRHVECEWEGTEEGEGGKEEKEGGEEGAEGGEEEVEGGGGGRWRKVEEGLEGDEGRGRTEAHSFKLFG